MWKDLVCVVRVRILSRSDDSVTDEMFWKIPELSGELHSDRNKIPKKFYKNEHDYENMKFVV